MIHNLKKVERTYFARVLNENGASANYLNLTSKTINSHRNCATAQHLFGAQVIALGDQGNRDAFVISELLFRCRYLSHFNQEDVQEQNEINVQRIARLLPPNGGSHDMPHQQETNKTQHHLSPILNQINEIPGIQDEQIEQTIREHMHKCTLKVLDLIPVGKVNG
ncbi:MAG: hypothetical protein EZS28_053660 [Streblomastix strix]|uniref:Uncharacterized protein n=1 Tax=Streblomastix strix TaxID=222440 RepID=A0A5J4R5G2_9EUKA|nr:MAG: hypothetical protein EZS28_053660 [Streblomastix strix]